MRWWLSLLALLFVACSGPASGPSRASLALSGHCSFAEETGTLTVAVPEGGTALLSRSLDGKLRVLVNGADCAAGRTVSNTPVVVVMGAAGAETFILAAGAGLPGMVFTVDLGGGDDRLVIRGSEGPDTLALGVLGVDLDGDGDVDVTLDQVERVEAYGLGGNDALSGRGGGGTGDPLTLPLFLSGGGGDDALWGGAGANRFVCGPGVDAVNDPRPGEAGGDCETIGYGLTSRAPSLAAQAGAYQVALWWSPVSGASSYEVYRSSTEGHGYARIAATTETSTADLAAPLGAKAFYRVQAVQGVWRSAPSPAVSAIATPAAPQAVSAAGSGEGAVVVSWAPVAGATRYQVLRASSFGGPFLNAGGTSLTEWTVDGLLPGRTYHFLVRAWTGLGQSADSAVVSASTGLAAPARPAASGGLGKIVLSWPPVLGAVEYLVLRAAASGGPYQEVAGTGDASYVDRGLPPGQEFFYVVRARAGSIESPASAEASARTRGVCTSCGPPPPPSNLAATAGIESVSLAWSPSPGATAYRIYRKLSSGGEELVATVTVTHFEHGGLAPGATYTYVVRAVNDAAEGSPSGEASACATESDAAFCGRLGAECGALAAPDVCGASRSVAGCGGCAAPATCGGGFQPNLCGDPSANPWHWRILDAPAYTAYTTGLAVSADGEEMFAVGEGARLRRSFDGGAAWGMQDHLGCPSDPSEDCRMSPGNTLPAVAMDPAGSIFLVNFRYRLDESGGAQTRLLKSTDGGNTFIPITSHQADPDVAQLRLSDIAADAAGALYLSGTASVGGVSDAWVVFKSADGGATWTRVDTYHPAGSSPGASAGPIAVSADGIFITGFEYTSHPGARIWITRYSADGENWETADSFVPPEGFSFGRAVAAAPGMVYATGTWRSSSTTWWLVRKGVRDAGSGVWTWTEVDALDLVLNTGGGDGGALSVGIDPYGTVWTSGLLGPGIFATRVSLNAGATWTTTTFSDAVAAANQDFAHVALRFFTFPVGGVERFYSVGLGWSFRLGRTVAQTRVLVSDPFSGP